MLRIDDMDPKDIKEIIETDTMRTAILTKEATERMDEACKEEIGKGQKITVEGEEILLIGFKELRRKAAIDEVVYFKVVPGKGHIQFAVGDQGDKEAIQKEVEPLITEMAEAMGLVVLDVRTMMTESIGVIKRKKQVNSMAELDEIFEAQEDEPPSDNHAS